MLPKIDKCRRNFDKTKDMSFFIKSNELLEKCNEIQDKINNNFSKRFDSEPVYNEKYLRTKISFCEGKFSTYFYRDKIPKEGFSVSIYQQH